MRYVLDYDFADAPHAFSWALVEGEMLRAVDGRYVFDAAADGTLVDYTLRVDLAIPLPGLIKRKASGMIVGTALRDLKRVVESGEHERSDREPGIPASSDAGPERHRRRPRAESGEA